MSNSNKEYRSKSYAEEAANDNSLFSAWTKKWGIHIRPWYAMDKLKFSFVDVGKAGKGDSFDICMDVIKFGFPCFKKWANDILSPTGRFERILASEAKAGEQYPKYYKYVTGDKGTKSIGICNSRNGGYVINASTIKDGRVIHANIPLDFGDLQIIAENFVRSYAEREAQLNNIRRNAEERVSYPFHDPDASTEKPVITDGYKENADSINTSIAPKEEPANETFAMKITLSELPVKLENEFMFKGVNEAGNDVELFVTNAALCGEQKGTWQRLADMLKDKKISITFIVKEVDGKIMIEKIA